MSFIQGKLGLNTILLSASLHCILAPIYTIITTSPHLRQGDAGLQAKLLQRTKPSDLLTNQARQETQLCCAQHTKCLSALPLSK